MLHKRDLNVLLLNKEFHSENSKDDKPMKNKSFNFRVLISFFTFSCLLRAEIPTIKSDVDQRLNIPIEQSIKSATAINEQDDKSLGLKLPNSVKAPVLGTIQIQFSDQREDTKSIDNVKSKEEDIGWKEFIASMLSSIAWPSVLILIFISLKTQIVYLFNKIAHFKYKDLEVDFDRVKTHAEAIQANEFKPDEIEEPTLRNDSSVFNTLEEQILETAEVSPSAAILLAWSSLEVALSTAVNRYQPNSGNIPSRSTLHNIETIEKSGELSKSHIKLINEMRVLRNKVSHESEILMSINQNQALDYARTAIDLINSLNNLFTDKKVLNLPKGNWIQKPNNFTEQVNKNANIWKYSFIRIPNTNLTAGIGPWSGAKDNYECFSIDIELEQKSGSKTLTELVFDLSYVSSNLIEEQASKLVSYDQQSEVVTFDLGNSVFKYQLI